MENDSITLFIIVPAATLLVTQIVKFGYHSFRYSLDFTKLFTTGNAPSGFIAVAFALAAAALLVKGVDSDETGITLTFVGLALAEYTASRRLGAKTFAEKITGLSLVNYSVSALIGITTAIILTASEWADSDDWFLEVVTEAQANRYIVLFVSVLIVDVAITYIARRLKYHRLPTMRRVKRAMNISWRVPAVAGIVLSLMARESIRFLDERLYPSLLVGYIVVGTVVATILVFQKAPKFLEEEADHFNKEKKTKKKSKAKSKKKRKK